MGGWRPHVEARAKYLFTIVTLRKPLRDVYRENDHTIHLSWSSGDMVNDRETGNDWVTCVKDLKDPHLPCFSRREMGS
jgi:hypothetical protein